MRYNETDERAFCTYAPFIFRQIRQYDTKLNVLTEDILTKIMTKGTDYHNGTTKVAYDQILPVSIRLAISDKYSIYSNVYAQIDDNTGSCNKLIGGYYIKDEDTDQESSVNPVNDAYCCIARNLICQYSPNREYDFVNWINTVIETNQDALKYVVATTLSIDAPINIGDISKKQWYYYCGGNAFYVIIPATVDGAFYHDNIMNITRPDWRIMSKYNRGRTNEIYNAYGDDFMNIMDFILMDKSDIFNL